MNALTVNGKQLTIDGVEILGYEEQQQRSVENEDTDVQREAHFESSLGLSYVTSCTNIK